VNPPAPNPKEAPLVGIFVAAAVLTAVVALGLISRLPGPQPPGAFRQMVVLHGSMARQLDEGPADSPQAHLESQLEGQAVESWLYALHGGAATVHRLAALPSLPRNAQEVRAEGGPVSAVDFDDLTAVCWSQKERGLCVVGGQPVSQLKELVARVRSMGPEGG
jgi:hypothetical protein